MADELFQKRGYELVEYIQLVLGDVGYEDPSSVWIAVDRAGWPKAMKMSLIQFIDAMSTQSEYYLNNGEPWANEAAVLAGFPLASRNKYDTVNIMGVEYWFQADKTTLVNKFGSIVLTDASVTLAKMANVASGSIFYRKTAGSGPPEVQTLATLKADLNIPDPVASSIVAYKITLSADADVAGKLVGATAPSGWTLTADDTNLIITHNAAGKEFAGIVVKEIDGGIGRVCAEDAYSGITEDGFDITIEGINPVALALTLIITLA